MSVSFKIPPKDSRERIQDALRARNVANKKKPAAKKRVDEAKKLADGAEKLADGAEKQATFGAERSASKPRKRMITRERLLLRFWMYFHKMRGRNPATYDFSVVDTLWSFGGAFIGMTVLGWLNTYVWGHGSQALLVGSFGASAMLVFGAPHAPFAQPRNVIGGHVVSALAGVFIQQHFGGDPWLASALAVALAVSAMHVTATLHPPGGATALIAVIGSPELKAFGYTYAFFPVGVSVAAMVLIGVLYNNLSKHRSYPVYWW